MRFGKIKLQYLLVTIYYQRIVLSIDNGDFDLLKIISIAVREMSEGELLQIEKARRLDITEDIYYEIIRKKNTYCCLLCTWCKISD
jgi:octaprenyl-diphosphate synthase